MRLAHTALIVAVGDSPWTASPSRTKAFLYARTLEYRPTLRTRLSTRFNFAIRRGYFNGVNPCVRLEPFTIPDRTPQIFNLRGNRPMPGLVQNPPPLTFAWFVLSTYAGLRPEEAQKTRWEMINFEEGWIRVEAQTSKVNQRRVVYPHPQALKLLKLARKLKSELPLTDGKLIVYRKFLTARLGMKQWPHDVTRHTAASMWLALTADAAQVANALGHSEGILHRNYKALVTKADAKQFWALAP